MKRIIFVFNCILYLLCMNEVMAQNTNRADEIRNTLLNPKNKSVLVVAHRGDWRYAPENS